MTNPSLLQPTERTKLDGAKDDLFYAAPRFVNHVDDSFIDRLEILYRERLGASFRILDLMSSWVSHLPSDIQYEQIIGHGLNAEELAKNPRLDRYFVQNLNEDPRLPLEDEQFDAVLNTVSVQYLQYPETVFAEIARILKPRGVAIISFSNRMFYQKAIAAWRDTSEWGRVQLVKRYFQSVPAFGQTEAIQEAGWQVPAILQMLGMAGGDPFYAVIAYKSNPLI
ncbi:MAG: class I SAM-dependent methyltransferase [Cyanobacteria bacterium P01_H01_bin.15]